MKSYPRNFSFLFQRVGRHSLWLAGGKHGVVSLRYQRTVDSAPRLYSSSRSCCQYLPENHPFILKDHNTNMYTHDTRLKLELTDEVTSQDSANQERHSDPPSFTLFSSSSTQSKARKLLQAEHLDMMRSVFFYHESNPHHGIISNMQFMLYDHYQLVGPVRQSWPKILMKDIELVESLNHHLLVSGAVAEDMSIAALAAIIERIASKRDASMCKYKGTVSDNTIQFRRRELGKEELVVLEVLAQYGYYDYEVIN